MNLTVAREKTILDFIHTKVDAIIPHTFKRPFYFGTKKDYAARAGVTYSDTLEAQFAIIRFKGYADDRTDIGCDDPTTHLRYRITLFFEYVSIRSDATISRQDITAAIIQLRSAFQSNQEIIANIATHEELIPIGEVTDNVETPFLKGSRGDTAEFDVLVEVT